MRTCTIAGCERPVKCRGLCSAHWKRWKVHGNPLTITRRENGTGWVNHGGYLMVNAGGRRQFIHRMVWEKANGPIPSGLEIHHKNGKKQDNRLENLELISRSNHARHHAALTKFWEKRRAV